MFSLNPPPPTPGGLFGGGGSGTSLFGGQQQQPQQGGLFGQPQQQGGGGLFGQQSQQQQPQQGGGGLFGQQSQQPQQQQQGGGGLFGQQQQPQQGGGGGLFGQQSQQPQQQGGGGLFGQQQPQQQGGGGLFGQQQPQQSGGGLFGGTPSTSSTSLFGTSTSSNAGGGGLFGASNPAQPQSSVFGSSSLFGAPSSSSQANLFGGGGGGPAPGLFGGGTAGGGGAPPLVFPIAFPAYEHCGFPEVWRLLVNEVGATSLQYSRLPVKPQREQAVTDQDYLRNNLLPLSVQNELRAMQEEVDKNDTVLRITTRQLDEQLEGVLAKLKTKVEESKSRMLHLQHEGESQRLILLDLVLKSKDLYRALKSSAKATSFPSDFFLRLVSDTTAEVTGLEIKIQQVYQVAEARRKTTSNNKAQDDISLVDVSRKMQRTFKLQASRFSLVHDRFVQFKMESKIHLAELELEDKMERERKARHERKLAATNAPPPPPSSFPASGTASAPLAQPPMFSQNQPFSQNQVPFTPQQQQPQTPSFLGGASTPSFMAQQPGMATPFAQQPGMATPFGLPANTPKKKRGYT